jgi:hypothetical protein
MLCLRDRRCFRTNEDGDRRSSNKSSSSNGNNSSDKGGSRDSATDNVSWHQLFTVL